MKINTDLDLKLNDKTARGEKRKGSKQGIENPYACGLCSLVVMTVGEGNERETH